MKLWRLSSLPIWPLYVLNLEAWSNVMVAVVAESRLDFNLVRR